MSKAVALPMRPVARGPTRPRRRDRRCHPQPDDVPHPRGLTLVGADITCPLDLTHATVQSQLSLVTCRLRGHQLNLGRCQGVGPLTCKTATSVMTAVKRAPGAAAVVLHVCLLGAFDEGNELVQIMCPEDRQSGVLRVD